MQIINQPIKNAIKEAVGQGFFYCGFVKKSTGTFREGIFRFDVKQYKSIVDGEIKSFFLSLHVFYLLCLAYLSGEFIKTDNGSIFYGEFAFMFILKRLSSLCTLVELEVIFGKEHTQLSRIQDHICVTL